MYAMQLRVAPRRDAVKVKDSPSQVKFAPLQLAPRTRSSLQGRSLCIVMGVRSAPRRTWSSWYSLRSLFSAAAIGAAMLPRRAAADMLYVVGGEVGQSATNSMERFNLDDPDAQWDLSMSMPSERLYHGVGVVNEEMYLVGGRGDKHNSITGCGGNGCNLEGVLRRPGRRVGRHTAYA